MQTSWGNRQQEVGMWALDMQFNAVKGLGGASNHPKLETMEYLHIRIQYAFLLQICKFANMFFLRNAHYAHKPETHFLMANSRTNTSLSWRCKEREFCCPKTKHARTATSVLPWVVHLGLVRKRKSPHVNWLQYKAAIPTPSSVRIKETSLRLRLVPCW